MEWLRDRAGALHNLLGPSLQLDLPNPGRDYSQIGSAIDLLPLEVSSDGTDAIGSLLDSLSLLIALDGVSEHVAARFRPVAAELLFRSTRSAQTWSLPEWEDHIAILAALAGWLPELWR